MIAENIDVLIEDELKTSYLNYAMSVIISRALPDVRDGLKPSQRRILVAMNDLNLGPRTKHRKCAKIAGDTSGNYHPHGEAVIYPTLVRMAQSFNMRYPLIDGQGNFGSIDGDPPAAMRYTEARMTEFAMELLEDLDKDTVDFRPNYDETRMEPVVLPGKFPNLLCNGSSGIAVGMATNIPPHNLGEICDAVIKVIEEPDCSIEDLLKIIKGPDFPTGALICGRDGIKKGYTTGRGKITLRARASIETTKSGKKYIVFTEIPYQLTKASIIEKIAELVNTQKITGISDIRDETDKTGMRIVIELKRGENEKVILNQLYKNTSLQTTYSIILVALVDNRPKLLNIKQLIEEFIKHRENVITRRTKFLLSKAEDRAHILQGLRIALDYIDEVIQIIKTAKDVKDAATKLMQRFSLTQKQTDAILQMRLQRLTALEREKLDAEYRELLEKIAEYKAILADRNLVLDIIKEDMYELKEKYAEPRKTDIVGSVDDISIEDLIADEVNAITLTHQRYIKRQALSSYRQQRRGGKGVIGINMKEEDFVQEFFIASTHDYLLCFTTKGRVYWLKVYDIPEMSRHSRGRALVNILQLERGENITTVIPVREFDDTRYLILATKKGIVKKTVLSAYGNPKKGGIIAINLDKDDTLVGAVITYGNQDIILGTRQGMAIRFSEEQLRDQGRATRGVIGIKLREGDEVVAMVIADDNKSLLTVCANGFGKRTPITEYKSQSRGGIGIIAVKTSERNGEMVSMHSVNDKDEFIITTKKGISIRLKVKDIRATGRATQGVKLVNLEPDDVVVSVAPIVEEESTHNNSEED